MFFEMDMHVCAHHVFVLSVNGQDHCGGAISSKKNQTQKYVGLARACGSATLGCRTIGQTSVRCVRDAEL